MTKTEKNETFLKVALASANMTGTVSIQYSAGFRCFQLHTVVLNFLKSTVSLSTKSGRRMHDRRLRENRKNGES
jgi:hypothetical protein